MDKKAKIALAVIQKVYDKFLKRNNLLTRHISKNATKKKFPLTSYFLTLLTIVNFFLCCVTIFSMVCYETHYFHLYLIDSRPF